VTRPSVQVPSCTVPILTHRLCRMSLVRDLCRGYIIPGRRAPLSSPLLSLSLSLLSSSTQRGPFSSLCASHSFLFAVVSILLISVDTDFTLSIHFPTNRVQELSCGFTLIHHSAIQKLAFFDRTFNPPASTALPLPAAIVHSRLESPLRFITFLHHQKLGVPPHKRQYAFL
jgi:hypothetical protein